MQVSQLKIYSKGTVAENLVQKDGQAPIRTIMVVPDERLVFLDGALKSNPTQDTVQGLDAQGNTVHSQVTLDNAVEATWLPHHSNRHTPPDVRRGERVLLWRFADMDTFYWSELGLDHHLRVKETVIYLWKATASDDGAQPSPANSYFVEVSTHKGLITFHTCKLNGEKTAFTVQFNPMQGKFIFTDDIGQTVYVDSLQHLIHLVNADKSEVTLDKQNITLRCDDTMNLTADKTVNLTTQTLNIKAKDINTDATNVTTKASQMTLNVDTYKYNGNSYDVQASTIKLGQITISNGAVTGVNGLASSAPVTAPNIN